MLGVPVVALLVLTLLGAGRRCARRGPFPARCSGRSGTASRILDSRRRKRSRPGWAGCQGASDCDPVGRVDPCRPHVAPDCTGPSCRWRAAGRCSRRDCARRRTKPCARDLDSYELRRQHGCLPVGLAGAVVSRPAATAAGVAVPRSRRIGAGGNSALGSRPAGCQCGARLDHACRPGRGLWCVGGTARRAVPAERLRRGTRLSRLDNKALDWCGSRRGGQLCAVVRKLLLVAAAARCERASFWRDLPLSLRLERGAPKAEIAVAALLAASALAVYRMAFAPYLAASFGIVFLGYLIRRRDRQVLMSGVVFAGAFAALAAPSIVEFARGIGRFVENNVNTTFKESFPIGFPPEALGLVPRIWGSPVAWTLAATAVSLPLLVLGALMLSRRRPQRADFCCQAWCSCSSDTCWRWHCPASRATSPSNF